MRAEQYELTSHVTRVHVPRLGRDYDLTQVDDVVAAQLVAAGCTRLRRKPVPAAPAASTTAATTTAESAPRPAKPARKKRGAAEANQQPR